MQSHIARLFAPLSLSILFLATPLLASAADLYVTTTGSDSNSCTQAAPCKTIVRASSLAGPGDTVHVASGTYATGIKTTTSGSASARLQYVSDTKWGAKLIGTCPANDMIWWDAGNYVDIIGFEFSDGGSASSKCRLGFYGSGSNSSFRSNKVHDIMTNTSAWPYSNNSNGGTGVEYDKADGGSNNTFDGNIIYNMGPSGARSSTAGHGIYMISSGTVSNNVVYNTAGMGITAWHGAKNINFFNNTVDKANDGGIAIGSGDSGADSTTGDYFIVANNIVTNSYGGISEEGTTGIHNKYVNNLTYGNFTHPDYSLQNGLQQTGGVFADPKYVSAAAGDYHLQSTSPAIDKGSATYAPSTDMDGAARPQGAADDIGAYEYGTSPSPSSDPVGWWKFDETSGTTASDASGNNHPGTLVSIPTWTTGKVGGALSFNGTTQYVTFGDNVDLDGSDITLSIWVKPDAIADYIPLIDKLSSGGNYRLVGYADGTVEYGIRDTANGYNFIDSAPGALKVGTWTHIAVVHVDGTNQATLYINGAAVGTKTFAISRRDTTEPLKSGYNANNATYYKGVVDDMRIYNRVLSASEVHALYNVAPPADTTAPSVPTGLTGTAVSTSQINLSWTASTDNVGVTGYKIFRDGAQVGTSATNSFSNTGLAAGTTYSYTVSAYDAAGNNSAKSSSVSVTTTGICYTGTSIWQNQSITPQTGNFEIQFDVTPNVSNMTDGVVGLSQNIASAYTSLANIIAFESNGVIDARNGGIYQAQTVVNYAAGNTYHVRMDVFIPTHTYSIYVTPQGSTEQTIGTNYAFRTEQAGATSINYLSFDPAAGNVTVCGITTTAILDTTAPSVPTGLSGTAISSTQIDLAWTASTDNVGVTGYKIFRDGTQIGTSATNSFSNTGLTASTVYSYTVAAYDAAGNTSAQSATVSVITKSATAQAISIDGRVTTTANLNVRSAASPSSGKIGTEPVGSLGTVIGGPTTANGHTWWQVKWDDGLSGWSIGNYLRAVATASSPAVGLSGQSPLALSQPAGASLIRHLLAQIQILIAQVQTLQAQVAAVGAAFGR